LLRLKRLLHSSNDRPMSKSLTQAAILLVDDDSHNLDFLVARLGMAGFENLRPALGGREALNAIKQRLPDLIILDVMMPEINGYEVVRQVRANYPQHFIPIILVSALQMPEDRVKGIKVGANDFLSRPFESGELIARVNSLLELKQARDGLESERGRLALLYSVSRGLTAQLDYHYLLRHIVALTTDLTGAAKALLVVLDRQGHFQEKILMRFGEAPYITDTIDPLVLSGGLLDWVIRNREDAIIQDVRQDERWLQIPGDDEPVGSAIAVPLLVGDQVVGVLLLTSPKKGFFQDDQLDLLVAIASQAAISLEHARLFEEAHQQKAHVEALLHQIGDPVIVTDCEGLITSINPASLEALDVDQSVLNCPLLDVFGPKVADLLTRAGEHGGTVSGEHTWHREQPDQRNFNISVSPIEGVGFLLIWQDVTPLKEGERVRLEDERAYTQRIIATFSKYMSLALVERVINDPDILTRRERREAIVVFADLRGFTRLTVEHPPDDVLTLLNDVFSEMIKIVYEHEGVVFDIIGDELMVGFNVPYDQPDAAQRALHAAIAMQRRFADLKAKWSAQGMKVGMGIGINRGPVLLGHVGGHTRMNYAMVGQAVNVAHRLVELAQDAQIVTLPEMLSDVKDGGDIQGIVARRLPPVQIKGIDEPMPVVVIELGHVDI
jgi:class 3 adenylate cyclase/DNA-binding response OmpR family regulator/PAS domain-containing protein